MSARSSDAAFLSKVSLSAACRSGAQHAYTLALRLSARISRFVCGRLRAANDRCPVYVPDRRNTSYPSFPNHPETPPKALYPKRRHPDGPFRCMAVSVVGSACSSSAFLATRGPRRCACTFSGAPVRDATTAARLRVGLRGCH